MVINELMGLGVGSVCGCSAKSWAELGLLPLSAAALGVDHRPFQRVWSSVWACLEQWMD